jgi:hypothetical protein
MNTQKYTMETEFVGKFSWMGKKLILIVPTDFHKEVGKLAGKYVKVHAKEILEK